MGSGGVTGSVSPHAVYTCARDTRTKCANVVQTRVFGGFGRFRRAKWGFWGGWGDPPRAREVGGQVGVWVELPRKIHCLEDKPPPREGVFSLQNQGF